MKTTLKLSALVMALILVFAMFTACGDKKSDSKSSDSKSSGGNSANFDVSTNGDIQTRGNITVMVPDGMILKGGAAGSDYETDPDFAKLTADEQDANCILIKVTDNENYLYNNYSSFRESASDAEDISFEESGVVWTGYKRLLQGVKHKFMIIGIIDGRYLSVEGTGIDVDSAGARAVLASISLTSGEEVE